MEEYKNINDIEILHQIINDLNKKIIFLENKYKKYYKYNPNNYNPEIQKIKNKKYYEENKEKIIRKNNENRKKLSKEKKNEYQRRWYHNKKLKENSHI